MSIKTPFGGIQVSSGDMAYATTVSTSYVDIVNISGNGYLTGISQAVGSAATAYNGQIKIIIDGSTIYDGDFSFVDPETYSAPQSLSFLLKFKSSLQVQHSVDNADATAMTSVSYALD